MAVWLVWGGGTLANRRTAMRMQFYAIEIARNRAGLNDWIYERAQKANK
ncbi:DUF757 domain protein [Aspergillus luchuensis]|uniref:DUF757 domain protein n=1 Tax=Aspergillus kawachii TaxID=1069201 RepID=A0A146FIU5_ASPKA|nr:DUF757 domain protein [Aspergillus luchuensis]